METKTKDIEAVLLKGIEALKKELTPPEIAIFFHHYNLGYGNYTEERSQWLEDLTAEEILNGIKGLRS
jgi:hypothetical protein